MSQHTPGPWELWTSCSWKRFGRVGALETVVCPTIDSDGHPNMIVSDADARLIAVAPDLLENAALVLKGFGEGVFVRDISGDDKPGWAIRLLPYVDALARLEVAIKTAKAEGGR